MTAADVFVTVGATVSMTGTVDVDEAAATAGVLAAGTDTAGVAAVDGTGASTTGTTAVAVGETGSVTSMVLCAEPIAATSETAVTLDEEETDSDAGGTTDAAGAADVTCGVASSTGTARTPTGAKTVWTKNETTRKRAKIFVFIIDI